MKFDYQKAWKEINELESKGLPKTALEKVEVLIEAAREEGESAQFVKGLIYQGKYKSQLEEDGFVKAIGRLQAEMEKAEYPVKSILQSMLAEMYAGYLDNNVWQFQNRTQTLEFKTDDIQTWTIQQLLDESARLYWNSLNDQRLRNTEIDEFSILLHAGSNNDGLRPTLFDFLAHRAIDHFMNERRYVTQPAYKFHIDNEKAFAQAHEFSSWKIETKDTASQKLQTLLLFQEVLNFHLEKDIEHNPALLDADLKRLKFVHQNAIQQEKDKLYLTALEKLRERYSGRDGEADIIFEVAQLYFRQGQAYKPVPYGEEERDEKKWLLKNADDLCTTALKNYQGTVGASKCAGLKRQIRASDISLKVEQVNLPDRPFLGKIEYRNTPKVWLKVIRFDESRRKKFEEAQQSRNGNKEAEKYLATLPALKLWSIDLPDDGDFRSHAVEFKFDKLPLGQYMIQLSDNEGLRPNGGSLGYTFTHISNLGCWERQGEGDGASFVVFDRESGKPLENVTAEFWARSYNSVFRKYELKRSNEGRTDEDGFVKSNLKAREDRNFALLLRNGKDTLFTDRYFYSNNYRSQNQQYEQTHFFLDRAIYRPGQTVYFKGIAMSFDEKRMPTILKNREVQVTFLDANYQKIKDLNLRTNEYGTFNGQFVAPRGGLLGQMSLQSNIGGNRKVFRVEEYKRPKFEVKFEPITGSFRLDDEVEISGKALAYAGSNIDGAQVTWRVVRETRFPWYWRRWWNPWRSQPMEIANGAGVTNDSGNFTIKFTALPDRSIPSEQKPEFNYTVYADVTDITGETQSNQTSVSVGYVALSVDIPIAEQVNSDSLQKLELVTKNLNGEYEAAKGTLTLEQFDVPETIFIDRYWERPDRVVMTEKEFKSAFPNYAWSGENEPEKWAVMRQIQQVDFDTEASKEVFLPKKGLPPGHFVVTLKTKDKYGVKVELKKFFSVFDLDATELPNPTIGWHFFDQKNYEPGEDATLHFGTSRKSQSVLFELEKNGNTIERKWLNFSNLRHEILKIKEEHRGNLSYTYSWAGLNRSVNNTSSIFVPWSNKELSIEFGTFRDKLKPGQQEEWLIKIKGPKGEKVAAEMVAGMYDASLDAFAPNDWGLSIFPTSWSRIRYQSIAFQQVDNTWLIRTSGNGGQTLNRTYNRLNWFDWYFAGGNYIYASTLAFEAESAPVPMMRSRRMDMAGNAKVAAEAPSAAMDVDEAGIAEEYSLGGEAPPPEQTGSGEGPDLGEVPIRTNLDETVFFYPNLMTDEEGNVVIKFKMNEALTRWKFLGLAHTQDLKIGTATKEVVTQKELMVVPNPPRFFRENDEIEFTAKVVNLSEKPLIGNAQLQLVNPLTSLPVFKWKDNPDFNSNFVVDPGKSTRLAWRFKVPDVADVPVIEHTVVAAAGDFSDAERSAAPVLSNRMMVTETMPLPVRGGQTKTFTFERMQKLQSPTLRHESLTLEFTQNPAWYAVQALPYLMEYPYECNEQIFSRYYANSLATSVANSHPKIKTIFDRWREYEPDALKSNLTKNQELKTALLEETPWVLNAQSEEQQKQNIALLFDLNRMSYEKEVALKKLQDRQQAGGGWAWFPGGRDSWYITQYIVEGLGHLQKLGVSDIENDGATWNMVERAVRYCDDRIVDQYDELERQVKEGKTKWEDDHLNYLAAHYLYARSFFLENRSEQAGRNGNFAAGKKIELIGKAKTVHAYYLGQAEKYWLSKGMYVEGMLALGLDRSGKAVTAGAIVKSLHERSLNDEEQGMYWKYPRGWWWYQAPIETHALMIEVFSDISGDANAVDDLKVWLLKNKQTNHWKTTKATASAVYALLSSGDNWLLENEPLDISFPISSNTTLSAQVADAQANAEAGTGYFKTRFDGEDIGGGHSVIRVENPNEVVAWGAMYWQYFEQLDKITTFEETPLTIRKQLFRVENTATGEAIRPVEEGDELKVGEKVKARIELRVDRDMEYVHMKDMRASGFEPINVLSQYKWQGGLGYYESTRDASTNFFFSFLPKGTWVFEYPLRVVHNGNFSNGITTVQCMYAPEFTSHSEGVRVVVE